MLLKKFLLGYSPSPLVIRTFQLLSSRFSKSRELPVSAPWTYFHETSHAAFGPAAACMYLPPSPSLCRSTSSPNAMFIYLFIDLWSEGMSCRLHVCMACYLHVCSPLGRKAWKLGTPCWPYAAGWANRWDRIGARISAVLRVDAIFFSIFYEQHNKPKKIKCEFYYNF